MAVDLPTVHRQALDATRDVVAGIKASQLDDPTPCDDWDVRTLLNHVVGGNLWVEPLVDGRTIEDVGDELDGDQLGDDFVAAYERSAEQAAASFEADGAMDAMVAVSYGPVPGSVYCGHRFIDVLIHGWDLAKASGQDATLDPALVEACWTVLEPELPVLAASGMFGVAQDPGPNADEATKLLAVLGRTP